VPAEGPHASSVDVRPEGGVATAAVPPSRTAIPLISIARRILPMADLLASRLVEPFPGGNLALDQIAWLMRQ
jgi:hypothetical protein